MNELMERLARANPVPPDEPPTPDDERAAEARLERIVADVVPDERPRPAPRLRRLAPAAGLLAVLAIAAVIAIDLLDTDEEGGGIVERAVAAVSQEDVIYASVERWTTRSVALDPGTDTSPDERVFARTWLWREGGRSHYLAYDLRPDGRPGRLRSEVVSTPERMVWFDAKGEQVLSYNRDRDRPGDEPPADDPGENGFPGFDPSSDPGAQLREHVDSGRLRVDGRTTVRGRTAFRLVARDSARSAPDEDFGTVVYLVDARTYLPLEMRQRAVFDHSDVPGGGRERATIRVEYLRYEALPVNGETKKLLEKGAGRRP
jgi:hypothetical protein